MTAKNRWVDVYAAANWCGYNVPATRPKTKQERQEAMRGIRTFYMAIERGAAPPPDGKMGDKNRWYESTLEKACTTPPKKGRKSKASEVDDAA